MGVDKKDSLLDLYYYLVPLWLLLEWKFFPGLRADLVFGGSGAGRLLFYGGEAAIGAGLWFKLPYSRQVALAENVVCLIFALKFLLLGPLDIAMNIDSPSMDAAAAAQAHLNAVPGIIYSSLHVVYRIKQQLKGGAGLPG